MTHTPTPWDYADRASTTAIYGKGYEKPIAIANSYPKGFGPDVGEREANAAHIVKCVNMHDELVEALKFIADSNMTNPQDFKQVARETLKKAGA